MGTMAERRRSSLLKMLATERRRSSLLHGPPGEMSRRARGKRLHLLFSKQIEILPLLHFGCTNLAVKVRCTSVFKRVSGMLCH